jgi:hypothetical protein
MAADIYAIKVFDDEALTALSSATSATFPVSAYKPLGNFASQLLITGQVDVDLWVSINGTSFVNTQTLFADYSTGEYLESHGLAVATEFYFVITEKIGIDATVTMWTAIQ